MKTHLPRKRFGQHFLNDENIIEKIVKSLHPQSGELLVEIGAGEGAITHRVLAIAQPLRVIEIDRDLVKILKEKYDENTLIIHEGDVLKFNFSDFLPSSSKMRLFGNLPYNISTPILFHVLKYAEHIQDMIFMLQKEVVDRMAAPVGTKDYGRLSVMIQYACQVEPLFDISPNSFSPPPKVMSSMVKLTPHDGDFAFIKAKNYAHFSALVNQAFQHRRKTLKNALGKDFPVEIILQCDLSPKQRPETVSVVDFVRLSNCVNT